MRHRDAPMRSSGYCATPSGIIRNAFRVPDVTLARLIVKNRLESFWPFSALMRLLCVFARTMRQYLIKLKFHEKKSRKKEQIKTSYLFQNYIFDIFKFAIY